MKLNLTMIAIAAAMASLAGTSHAALTSGSTVNNGSMALVAYNTVNKNWYIRDLGYLINDFMPSSITTLAGDGSVAGNKTPDAGLTINGTTKSNFSDASFTTWYNQQTSPVVWMVGAYDQLSSSSAPQNQRRMVVSSTNSAETSLNSNLDSFVTTAFFGGLQTFFGGATLSNTGVSLGGLGDGSFQAGVSLATVGNSQSLFYVARGAFSGSTTGTATTTAFGNSTGLATITLSTDGELVYSLAGSPAVGEVPVPAAVWLLGSGLLAMGAAARRRRAADKA
jgi:hypothetical protein